MPELPRRSSGEPFKPAAHAALTDEQIAMHALAELVHVDGAAAESVAATLDAIVGKSVLDMRAADLLRRLARDA